jgi:hypothetical protein
MEDNLLLENVKKLLTEKYEPILIVKMMRIPSLTEMEGFRLYIKNEFGYNSIIFPGEMETDVKLISILDFEESKLEDIQKKMNDLIEKLEKEAF